MYQALPTKNLVYPGSCVALSAQIYHALSSKGLLSDTRECGVLLAHDAEITLLFE